MRKKIYRKPSGNPIPIEMVEKILIEEFYSVADLIKLDLFFSENAVYGIVKDGLIKFQKMGAKSIFFTRKQVIDYFKEYRIPEVIKKTELVNASIAFSKEEIEIIDNIVDIARKKTSPRFTRVDLFRNFVNYLASVDIDYSRQQLFKLNP